MGVRSVRRRGAVVPLVGRMQRLLRVGCRSRVWMDRASSRACWQAPAKLLDRACDLVQASCRALRDGSLQLDTVATMAAAAAALAVHNIVKEAADVGVGLISLYKEYRNRLQRGASHPQAGNLRDDMKTVEQAIQNVFDNQACLLALVFHGPARICSAGLDALQLEINQGFDSVMQTVQDEVAIRAARGLKTKLGMAALACDRMLEGVVAAAESQQRQFTPGAMMDIDNAEISAAELYIWASSFVPSNPRAMTKQSKFQAMPYIVAMAYAARVQAIAHALQRDGMEHECDQIACLKRARVAGDDFIAVLAATLEGVMANTTLLEIAMDYQLPMAMYLTIMTSVRASMEELLSPSAEHRDTVVWDDGLSPIRDVLHYKPSDAAGHQEHTIEFNSIAEGMWWLAFTNTDLAATYMRELRKSIHISDVCRMLGPEDDDPIDHIALIPGQKTALLQLPPANALRAALCANIAHAHHAAPPPPTFARTGAPPPALHAAAPRTLSGHTNWIHGVAVCPDGDRVLSASADRTVRLWRLSSGQPLCTLSGHTSFVNCVAVSPDGKMAVTGSSDKSVRVWSVESGSIAQHILQGHSDIVEAVAVSPDGRSIASGSWDKTVRLWNAESRQCQATLSGHSDKVYGLAFSPDGSTLISGSADKSIRVWNVRSCELERSLQGHSSTVFGVAVTPDGRRVVSGSGDRTVRVWKLSSGAEEMKLEGHTDAVSCVAVFPDGLRIVSGSWDKSIRVWNVRSKAFELTLTGHNDRVRCVAVSPEGRSVVSCSQDKTIKVWALSEVSDGAAG